MLYKQSDYEDEFNRNKAAALSLRPACYQRQGTSGAGRQGHTTPVSEVLDAGLHKAPSCPSHWSRPPRTETRAPAPPRAPALWRPVCGHQGHAGLRMPARSIPTLPLVSSEKLLTIIYHSSVWGRGQADGVSMTPREELDT